MASAKLIYDVGMNDGVDTAYYLSLGYHVVAIEANPSLVKQAQEKFETEIHQGRLRILNLAIASAPGVIPFWICESNHGWSSLDEARLRRSGVPYHRADVEGRSLGDVIAENGIPHYMKIDVEGGEQLCLDGLSAELAPPYLSLELFSIVDDSDGGHHAILQRLRELGYKNFALINQVTHTSSTPIFHSETGCRALRKVCHIFPFAKNLIRALPDWLRPKKIEFDPQHAALSHSGPFGEDLREGWLTPDETVQRADWLWSEAQASKHTGCHFDLHCKR